MKRKLTLYSAVIILTWFWCAVMYYGILGLLAATNTAYHTARASVIARVAAIGGYVPAQALPETTVLGLCTAAAKRQRISPVVYCAVTKVESNQKDWAFSHAGAIGPAQVMPANYKFCKLSSPTKLLDPVINLDCGAQIFAEQLKVYNNDILRAAYGYNASPKGVRIVIACGHNTSCMGQYKETYNYGIKVLRQIAVS